MSSRHLEDPGTSFKIKGAIFYDEGERLSEKEGKSETEDPVLCIEA